MANETNIKIKVSPDGKDYTIEIVEKDALTGTRIDQVVAQGILNFESMNRDENFKRAWEQFKQQIHQQTQMPQQMPPQTMRYGQPYAQMPPMPNRSMYGGYNPYMGGWGGY